MKHELLFEIGTEEIPAKFMPGILDQLQTTVPRDCRSCEFPVKTSGFSARRGASFFLLRASVTPRKALRSRARDRLSELPLMRKASLQKPLRVLPGGRA
jgi:hypothetical protein